MLFRRTLPWLWIETLPPHEMFEKVGGGGKAEQREWLLRRGRSSERRQSMVGGRRSVALSLSLSLHLPSPSFLVSLTLSE